MDEVKSNSSRSLKRSESASNVKDLISLVSQVLDVFQQNIVPIPVSKQIFHQVYAFINASVFNEVMLRRNLCKMATGMEYKMKFSRLEEWAKRPENRDWVGDAAKGPQLN